MKVTTEVTRFKLKRNKASRPAPALRKGETRGHDPYNYYGSQVADEVIKRMGL